MLIAGAGFGPNCLVLSLELILASAGMRICLSFLAFCELQNPDVRAVSEMVPRTPCQGNFLDSCSCFSCAQHRSCCYSAGCLQPQYTSFETKTKSEVLFVILPWSRKQCQSLLIGGSLEETVVHSHILTFYMF